MALIRRDRISHQTGKFQHLIHDLPLFDIGGMQTSSESFMQVGGAIYGRMAEDNAEIGRIGIVVHGPEIIDSGRALSIINHLRHLGRVTAVLGGTMGRVAVIDACLEDVIAVSPWRRPSQSVQDLEEENDLIIILNQAKGRESGLAFGTMVARAANASKPLIQIDCGGRFVAVLAGEAEQIAAQMAADLGLDIIRPLPPSLPQIQSRPQPASPEEKTIKRTLSGVLPGELVSINGIVIGRATHGRVEIEVRGGRIVALRGMQPKQHGIDKLPAIDLAEAIIRSGSIRRSRPRPGPKASQKGREGFIAEDGKGHEKIGDGSEYAVFIDHCAEDAFEVAGEAAGGYCYAVTVGDDTTAIAADILARLGIPVIGIVDGDLDRLAEGTAVQPGSIILKARAGHDDLVGRSVHTHIFGGKDRAAISRREMLSRIMDLAGESIESVSVNTSHPKGWGF